MGELIGVYKVKALRFLVMRVSGAGIFAIGALIVWALSALNYSGSITALAAFALFLLALGAFFIYSSFVLKPKYYFEAYENGVVVKRKSGDVSLMFSEIEDVLPYVTASRENLEFRINNVAFRKDAQNEWFVITFQYENGAALIDGFLELHAEHRGSKQVEEIEKAGFTSIKYVEKSALTKEAFSPKALIDSHGEYLKKYENYKTLYLAADHIKIENQTVYFDQSDRMEIKGLTSDTIYIIDQNGKEKFSIPYLAVFSPDIFIAILSTKVEFKR
ncbi:MAG: hypothetical protein LBF86_04725 [Helicobacteraceae bacterium]|nr:hypothetical protein [Helicobacteraceae bacterium]